MSEITFLGVPEGDEDEAVAVTAIHETLNDALIKARQACGFEGETLDRLTAIALSTLVWRQGRINPVIPIAATRTLMEMAIEHGHDEDIGITQIGERPERLQ